MYFFKRGEKIPLNCNKKIKTESYVLIMDDIGLIEQTLKGNDRAFAFLVKKYQKLVLHITVRILNNKEDVEDVCQEVFIKVFRRLETFKGNSKLSTWIASIAYRVALDHLRKQKKSIPLSNYEIPVYKKTESNNKNIPDKILENKELKAIMEKEIEQLPLPYKTIITLYHLQEFSYKEIEEITGIKMGTLKSYLSRARKMLKEKLIFVLKTMNYEE